MSLFHRLLNRLYSASLYVVLTLGMLTGASAQQATPAQEPAPVPQPAPAKHPEAAQWEVIAECQMIVLPQKAALPLLADLADDAKIEVAFASLQKMIEQREATLAANLLARGLSGNKLAAQSVEEMRYATEFDPPQLPGTIPAEKPAEVLKAWPAVGITPTAFETRNVGPTLDLTATVSPNGKWIAADAAPKHVRFLRNIKFDAGVLASGDHLNVEQPLFTTLSNTCSLQVRAGQRVLLGVHKVPAEENMMELFFLRIRTQATGGGQ